MYLGVGFIQPEFCLDNLLAGSMNRAPPRDTRYESVVIFTYQVDLQELLQQGHILLYER